MMTHIADAQLHDYVDDDVESPTREALDAHLSTCGECAVRLHSLRDLRAALHALPSSIEPDADLLPGIRARMSAQTQDARTERTLRLQVADASARERRVRWPMLAAAAVMLCVLSSAVTYMLVRSNSVEPAMSTQPAPVGAAQLVELRATEARYQDAIAELRAALREQGVLEPETVRLLEQSLTTIDRALAEARAALAADPANAALAEMLHANYEKKLDLLRRASAHARVRL